MAHTQQGKPGRRTWQSRCRWTAGCGQVPWRRCVPRGSCVRWSHWTESSSQTCWRWWWSVVWGRVYAAPPWYPHDPSPSAHCQCQTAAHLQSTTTAASANYTASLRPSVCLSVCLSHVAAETYTHTRLTALCPGLPGWAGTRIWNLLKQETVSGSGISWAVCKSAPRSRQITTPAPHHSVFYRPDALPAAQPTVSKHIKACPAATHVYYTLHVGIYNYCTNMNTLRASNFRDLNRIAKLNTHEFPERPITKTLSAYQHFRNVVRNILGET